MLDNLITLPVDQSGNNTTFVNEVLTRFRETENKTTYRFPDFKLADRNQIDIYRNDIMPSGNYLGNAKGTVKITDDTIVLAKDGTEVVTPQISSLAMSIPVGTSDATFYANLGRLQALVNNKALMYAIFMDQNI